MFRRKSYHPKKKRTKKRISSLIIGVGIVVVLTIIAVVYIFRPNQASARWFDDAWSYRTPVAIANGSGGALTDFQVKVTVDSDTLYTANKVQADCDDLRFTDNTGNLLSYWIEDTASASETVTCNSADIDVWIKMSSIPTTGATIYMYYGNANASSLSNGKSTFEFFEDFSTATLDPVRWAAATGSASIANGEITVTTGSIYTNSSILSNAQNIIYEQRVKWTTTTGIQSGLTIADDQDVADSNSGSDALVMLIATSAASYDVLGYGANGLAASYNITTGTTQYTASASTYHVSGFSLDGTNLRYYNNRTQTNSYAGNWTSAPYLYLGFYKGSTSGVTDVKDMVSDWVIARKYASSVPTVTVGTEEKGTAPISYWSFDEGNGTTAYDSIKSHNGTLTNGPAWRDEADCINGKCLYFDGVDDYVAVGNITDYKIPTKTITFWAKPSGLPSAIAGVFSNNGANYYAGFTSSGRMFTSHQNSVPAQITTNSNTNQIASDEWHLYSYVFNVSGANVDIYMYMDGNLVKTTNYTDGAHTSYGSNFILGSFGTSSFYFKGFLDEIKIYNYALTTNQIKQEFNAKGSVVGAGVQVGGGGVSAGESLTKDLVGYYPLDEQSVNSCTGGANDACDYSGNTNDMAWDANDPTPTAARYGYGADFEASTTDFISSVSDNASLSPTGDLTLSAWFKLETVANSGIISKDAVSPSRGYYMSVQSSKIRFLISDDGNNVIYRDSATTLTTGVWYHVISTYNSGTRTMDIYLNGSLDNAALTGTIPGSIYDNNVATRIGHSATNGYFDGIIDEARIYGRSFNTADVSALYNWGKKPVLSWGLENNTGTSATDSSSFGNTGTLTNGPTWMPGRIGTGVSFDGSDDVITLATASDSYVDFNGSEGFSGGAWVYVTTMPGSGNQDAIIAKYDQTSTLRGYRLILENDDADSTGNFQVDIYDESADQTIVATGANDTVVANTWYYVAFSFNGGTAGAAGDLRLYTNGKLTGSNTLNASFLGLEDIAVDFTVGDYDTTDVVANNTAFTGVIDHIQVYDYPLSARQIESIMNGGTVYDNSVGSPVGHPIGYWKMDDGYGTTALDSSINSNSATLAGTTVPAWKNDGKFSKALDFTATTGNDGSRFYASPMNVGPITGDQLTLSMWIKPDATQTNANAVFVRNGLSADGNYYSYFNGPTNGYYNIDTGWHNGTSFTGASSAGLIVQANAWNHYVMVITQGVNIKYYVNGILRSTVAMGSSSVQATTNFALGGHAGTTGQSFDGYIDEVKVYSYGLTANEIAADYNTGKSAVFGALSTESNGTTSATNNSREYCVPGDTTSCSSPVAEWRFDENTGSSAFNTSETSNTGAFFNSTTWTNGKYGSAVLFHGVNDYINIDNVSNTNFTYSFWYKTTSASTSQAILQTDDLLFQLTNTGNYNYNVWNGRAGTGASKANTAGTYVADTWYYITIAATGSTSINFYINGTLISSSSSADTPSFSYTDDRIGSLVSTVPTASRFFTGTLDNLRVYNYVRTPAQIAWEYNQGAPIALYKFDECEGTTAYNASKNGNGDSAGNNGTITAGDATGSNDAVGTCPGSAGNMWSDGASGKYSSSLEFDGTNDYVEMANDTYFDMPAGEVTISAWVNMVDSTNRFIFEKSVSNSVNSGYSLFIEGATTKFRIHNGTSITDLTYGTQIPLNEWHHLLAVNSATGNYRRIYLDGKLVASTTGSVMRTGSGVSRIGAHVSNGYYFNGKIDDVRIYNYALSTAQAQVVYNDGAVAFR